MTMTMRTSNPLKYVAKVLDINELAPYLDPIRIEGYCMGCPNYGKLWSCPPHGDPMALDASPLMRFNRYQYVLLVASRVIVEPSENTMAIFQQHRRAFAKNLEVLKMKSSEPSDYLIAGNCYLCDANDCSRNFGAACRYPKRMAYSLEAIGYDVCGITEGLLDITIEWSAADSKPKTLTTVGAIFSDSKAVLHQMLAQLDLVKER